MSVNAISVLPSAVNVGVPPSSLYVGDLHPDVTESMLFEKFSSAGQVLSIRVCRDAVTRASLGYAYVNFQQRADAERALENMNFDLLLNKPLRIMWSQRDPSVRRSGSGNIFIKNLSKHIDTKSMYDTFSMFGNILSCKVATDLGGNSKGYGFIHFETEEAATKAIDKVNGMLLEGKTVFVAKFIPRIARHGESGFSFNNLYVKNFGDELDKDKLEKLFVPYGEITSCIVMLDENNKSRGFGFVCFKQPEEAEKAANDMNNYALPETDRKLTVCRVLKKGERQAELKRRYDQMKMERMQKFHGVNLYVKNLDDEITEEALRQNFEGFGPVTSAKIMCDDNKRSRGFGFVCFENAADATKAVVEMNNKMLGTKPLYVALAQRKEDRKAQLASHYMQRLASMRMQNTAIVPSSVYAPSGGYFLPTSVQNQRQANFVPMASVYGSYHQNASIRWPTGQGQWPQGYGQQGGQYTRVIRGHAGGQNRRGNHQGAHHRGVSGQQIKGGNTYQGNAYNGRAHGHFVQGVQGDPHGHFVQGVQGDQQGHIQLTSEMLADAKPEDQKQMIGNVLIPLIKSCGVHEAELNKITGMILEMENSELLNLLEDAALLKSKVEEAVSAYRAVPKESAE